MSASAASSSSPLKLTKAQLAERAKEFHRNRSKNSSATNSAAADSSSSSSRVDPLEQVLNSIVSSTDQSYDEFVRSFDDDAEIERKDENGKNALTVKKEKLMQPADGKTEQQEDSATTTTSSSSSLPPQSGASSSSSSTAPPSDLILLIRMLQEDKERMKHDTRIVTGMEQTAEEETAALFRGNTGSSAIRMTRAEMDCIRVDDSYGFTADPFAPEAAQRGGTNEASEDVEEGEDESVITRVLGEDDAVAAGADDEVVSSSSHVPVSYTEDEAGASLESLPVDEAYTYSSENDRMTEEQWRQRRFPPAAAVMDGPRIEEVVEEDEVASSTSVAASSASAAAATPSLNANSTRGASRLAADELVAARRHRTHEALSTSDQVEIFHYDPTRNDNEYAQEEKEQPEQQQEVQRVVRAAVGMQRAVASTAASISGLNTSSVVRPPVTTSSSSSSSSSSAPRIIHRPAPDTTRPPTLVAPLAATSAFSSNSEGSDVDDQLDEGEDGIETVDLATQATTSVPIIRTVASSSSVAGTTAVASHRAPTVRIGNLLDPREQMGFEMDEEDEKVNEEDEEDERDPHDNDISDHSDAEWLDVASLDTPSVPNAAVPRRRM